VKPWELLGEARMNDGTLMVLQKRDTEYALFAGGKLLMSSRMHGSEEALAAFACATARTQASPNVLVGGLGMGFTLRATLDLLPSGATITVAELQPAIVTWNQGRLGPLAGHPLKDARVRVETADVARILGGAKRHFDAVMLDIDNGPEAFTTGTNASLYGDAGLAAIRRALKLGGILAVWSAWEDRKFEQRLRYAGFSIRTERVRARLKQGGPRHTIFVGTTSSAPTGRART